jgi:hypothetical protein
MVIGDGRICGDCFDPSDLAAFIFYTEVRRFMGLRDEQSLLPQAGQEMSFP